MDRLDPAVERKKAQELGRQQKSGAPCKAVVSVLMLREGWDVPEVGVILLLRKFGSRVYGQQVIKRGLRRVRVKGVDATEPQICAVVDHPKLELQWLVAAEAMGRFNHHLQEDHYPASRRLAGQALRYVAERDGQWVALLTFSAPALHLKAREQWIGWTRGSAPGGSAWWSTTAGFWCGRHASAIPTSPRKSWGWRCAGSAPTGRRTGGIRCWSSSVSWMGRATVAPVIGPAVLQRSAPRSALAGLVGQWLAQQERGALARLAVDGKVLRGSGPGPTRSTPGVSNKPSPRSRPSSISDPLAQAGTTLWGCGGPDPARRTRRAGPHTTRESAGRRTGYSRPRHADSRTGLGQPAAAQATPPHAPNQMNQPWAHLSFLQAVAAGILPAVEGGILAARNERGSGRAT